MNRKLLEQFVASATDEQLANMYREVVKELTKKGEIAQKDNELLLPCFDENGQLKFRIRTYTGVYVEAEERNASNYESLLKIAENKRREIEAQIKILEKKAREIEAFVDGQEKELQENYIENRVAEKEHWMAALKEVRKEIKEYPPTAEVLKLRKWVKSKLEKLERDKNRPGIFVEEINYDLLDKEAQENATKA